MFPYYVVPKKIMGFTYHHIYKFLPITIEDFSLRNTVTL